MENNNLKKEISLFMATMLVCGNMIGSGVFMLPATLAQVSGPLATIIAWIITTIGSILIAISFANLGSKYPATGGAYQYTKEAFGEFTGFLSAWLYWNGSWIGNAAIIVALSSYSASIIPALQNPLASIIYTSSLLWIFTILNIVGVKEAGKIQTFVTVFKIAFFGVFIIAAFLNFDKINLMPLMPDGKGLSTIPLAATSTLWAFVGLESSTVTAGEIRDPEKNVRKSTIYGLIIASIIYILISVGSMGAMSNANLSNSSAPLTDILTNVFGNSIGKGLTIAVVICILGTTIGWLLSTARVSYAAGIDGVFPKFFGKLHPKYGTPINSLISGSVLVNILLIMNYQKSMVSAFTFITILATLSFLPVYLLTVSAEMMLTFRDEKKFNFKIFMKKSTIPLLAFAYSIWTIYGSGAETVMWGFILMLIGIPFYIYNHYNSKQTS
ncbi:amino acid permease [Clostridium botulinum]|uniref:APC family permease n=1 Tax=Clostridium botulinum TaxID=1491 RepID=UPI0013C603C0|nr:amino acid permease [Clostridium botulinum]MBN1042432.1 amino acid permease [Clostridium botulinum]MBY6837300.1 amino acid permease [Clostridium botulinum]NFG63862.1 amino acid permease [Clostridium botulinum]NFL34633.1 amino acid permease [Clostridium botulinum]NFM03041.1 amino acid permease [Clostridium botulinum]